MPVVVTDDILTGFENLWKGSQDIQANVPGGIAHQRPAGATTTPYALMKCVAGEFEDFSGHDYIQDFTLTVEVYANAAPPNTGPIVRAVEKFFDRKTDFSVPNAVSVLHIRPVKPEPSGLELAPQTKDAQNMLIARAAWEIKIQANRST